MMYVIYTELPHCIQKPVGKVILYMYMYNMYDIYIYIYVYVYIKGLPYWGDGESPPWTANKKFNSNEHLQIHC